MTGTLAAQAAVGAVRSGRDVTEVDAAYAGLLRRWFHHDVARLAFWYDIFPPGGERLAARPPSPGLQPLQAPDVLAVGNELGGRRPPIGTLSREPERPPQLRGQVRQEGCCEGRERSDRRQL